jgi:protein-tyrosine phosphatase
VIDAHEIVPLLWQGSKPRPGRWLADIGFEVLVLCAREYQPTAVSFPGLVLINAPNDDHYFVSREDLQGAVDAASLVAEHVKAGRKVLVTCLAGINRSGLVVALALHKAFGYSGQTCINLVRAKRRLADGDDVALTNTLFVEALQRLKGTELRITPPILIVDRRAGT